MNKKSFIHISLFIITILFSVLTLINCIDTISLLTNKSGATLSISGYFICVTLSIFSCILMLASLGGLISTFLIGNYNAYKTFYYIFILTFVFLLIAIIILFAVSINGRINLDILSLEVETEEELFGKISSLILSTLIKPSIYYIILACVSTIISFVIFYYDQEIVEEVVEEPKNIEVKKSNNNINISKSKILENKIEEVEEKLKAKELEDKYQALLKKLEDKK